MPADEKKNGVSKDFEKNLSKLEGIVQELDQGELDLDKSIDLFEKGVKLYKKCKVDIVKAEERIKILTESLDEEDY